MTNTFLAANSANGFYSLFSEMTRRTDHSIYLIKGGPGTGKSSLMKKAALAALSKGMEVEQMHCSSDPESLDGLWIKDKKVIFLDATAPHCVDPRFPGAVEQILPLGEYWDTNALKEHKTEIISLSQSISGIFKSIYRLLGAVGQIQGMSDKIVSAAFAQEKAVEALTKFFRRQAILPLHKKGQTEKRFISAVSQNGVILYEDIVKDCKQVLLIEDPYECSFPVTDIANKMLADMGYDRICALSPLHPERIDHLIVPECSLAIITQNHRLQWQSQLPVVKTMQLKTFLKPDIISQNKNKLAFSKKLCKSLYDEVADYLASEKTLHDRLESFYINAMDFEALNKKSEQFIAEIIK